MKLHRWDLDAPGQHLQVLACDKHALRTQELIDFWLEDVGPEGYTVESTTYGDCDQCRNERMFHKPSIIRRIKTWLRLP